MMDKRSNVVGRTYRTIWSDMKEGDIGQLLEIPSSDKMSIQVFGDFDDAVVIFQGSNENRPVKFFTLKDDLGDDLHLSEEGSLVVAPFVAWFRPVVVGGTEDTLLTVVVLDRTVQ